MCEIADHPWFLGCQFHPEFKSKPLEPHPLSVPSSVRRSNSAATAPTSKRANICMPGSLRLLAGPCVIESEEHVHFLAHAIRKVAGDFVFKASFDKANRSSISSYRGPGLKEGLRILAGLRKEGFEILTDIHEPAQPRQQRRRDILQIPAFLCRQTDILIAAGRTGKIVNIKKGQFVAPQDMRYAVDKVRSTGNDRVMLTERGSSFGYNNLVVDMRALTIMREFEVPVIFDATHSVQLPEPRAQLQAGSLNSSSRWPAQRWLPVP
ncbi:MAG: 3-deoxy-8-phosphooctulonate synthase [Bryobacteraceae bacterium]